MIILHGDDILASRQELENIKNKYSSSITFTPQNLDVTKFVQSLEGTTLFGETPLVILEDTLSSSKHGKELLEVFPRVETEYIVVWEPKMLTSRVLEKLGKTSKVKLFKLRSEIFRFLESITPANKQKAITIFHSLIKTDAPERIFFMLVRQIRQILLISFGATAEDMGVSPWQWKRLKTQQEQFDRKTLLRMYSKLLSVDWEQKSGLAGYDLASSLDVLFSGM
ncbi:MAG TPA: hypothetical protein VJB91_02550 [Patescibacteria group bacterium]|nr:hypothetical protein [Patescibacteria group bacterium]